VLVSQGPGKPRRIHAQGIGKARKLRIAFLLYEPADRKNEDILNMTHQLVEAGHYPFFAKRTLVELSMGVNAVSRLVEKTQADAWVVEAGSLPVLDWFSKQAFPAFALFGRAAGLPIASALAYTIPAVREAVNHLISIGHRRIVMIAREDRRKPKAGFTEQLFLDTLEARGIPTGSFNLPDWEETPRGLHSLLDSLFRHTPPTALLIQGAEFTTATMLYCAHHGIRIPKQLSVISMDPDKNFAWSKPEISHISFDRNPLIRRFMTWINNLEKGKDDRQMMTADAIFVRGNTTAPPAGKS
jgi:DNA-binding LacI/PurR family transcriptional regulator